MMRWQSNGQSCISPSMAFSLGSCLSRRSMDISAPNGPTWLHRVARQGYPRLVPAQPEKSSLSKRCVSKPAQRETRDVMGCCSRGREVGEDLPDHRCEFETVTRTGRGDDDVGSPGQ